MSIKAYATVRLTGCNIRRFINLCTANHIKIWNLKYVSPKEYEACCSTEDIFLMKPEKDAYKASRGKKTGILCDKSISI